MSKIHNPRLFFKTVEKSEDEKDSSPFSGKKLTLYSLALILAILIVGYFGLQLKNTYSRVSQNWNEIKFAYEKPSLVRAVRTDYEEKQNKLDQSFLQKDKTSEEKLVDEVVKKLQESK